MERVGALIERLAEQHEQGVPASQLLVTVQMLLAELQQEQKTVPSTKKITVILPSVNTLNTHLANGTETHAPDVERKKTEVPKLETEPVPVSIKEKTAPAPEPVKTETVKEDYYKWAYDPVKEVPTLAHQDKELLEINELIGVKEESLNERLRVEKLELASVLKETPIRDLKKAIGINDRYLFVNDLFRGDDTMYERSIKTINSFNILVEAEYWIQRELKVKLGWNEDTEAVKHFDQLVRRRFS